MDIIRENNIKDNRVKPKTVFEFTKTELELIKRFGDPEIELGGTFSSPSVASFTLDPNNKKLKSGSPFVEEFDAKDLSLPVAISRAKLWQETIEQRSEQAINNLRVLTDDFSGRTVRTV